MSGFPFHHRHAEAVCIDHGLPLRHLAVSGYAPGRGAYKGRCPQCERWTYYDCAEGPVELIDLDVARGDRSA